WDAFMPRVTSATANNALAIVNHKTRSPPKETTALALPDDGRLPKALPENIFVKRLEAESPWASGRCTIVTQVRGQWLQDMFSLQLQTRNTPDAVNLDITYTSSANQPALRFALVSPNLIQLNGNTRLSPDENWLGDLQLNLQPPAESWVDYLQRWYAFDVAAIGAGNVQFSGMANLQLNSETLDFEISEGEVQITAAEWSPVAAMKLTNINIKQKFTAQWQPDVLSYSLLEAGEVYAD